MTDDRARESLGGRLSHLGLLRFAGPDDRAFLQGQITNDTRRLASGRPLLAAYTTPQGRVLAVLHLLPHSSGVLAILPRELAAPTAEHMRKFVLRAKLRIETIDDELVVAGLHDAGAIAAAGLAPPGEAEGYCESDGIGVAHVGGDPRRFWVVGAPGALRARGLAGDSAAAARIEHDWRLADVRAGLPQIYAATSGLFVPQMLNLDRIDGISFAKGCYTGQEIVARTQHLGRIKRRLHRLAVHGGAPAIGGLVRLADGRTGRLTELQSADGGFEALAVVAVDAAGADAEPADESAAGAAPEAAVLPLPYAL